MTPQTNYRPPLNMPRPGPLCRLRWLIVLAVVIVAYWGTK